MAVAKIKTKVITPNEPKRSQQRDAPIRIKNNLSFPQSAGKIARERCDWFCFQLVEKLAKFFQPITKRSNHTCVMTFDRHLKTAIFVAIISRRNTEPTRNTEPASKIQVPLCRRSL